MTRPRKSPNERALAIARGLVVTSNAKAVQDISAGGFIKLFAGNAVHYWVRNDGGAVYRVANNDGTTEEQMSIKFVDEMALAGNASDGKAVELVPQMPSPKDDPSLYDDWDFPYTPPGWVNSIKP